MSAFAGVIAGLLFYLLYRTLLSGFYTVQQNERAVVTSFGRAQRLEGKTYVVEDGDVLNIRFNV